MRKLLSVIAAAKNLRQRGTSSSFISSFILHAAVAVAFFSVPAVVFSQTASTSPIPRTSDGKPDFSGFWQVITSANWNIQDHSAEKGIPGGQGIVVGNEIPYQPWAAVKQKENYQKRATGDPEVKSYVPGVPRITYTPFPFQIVQPPILPGAHFAQIAAQLDEPYIPLLARVLLPGQDLIDRRQHQRSPLAIELWCHDRPSISRQGR